jgi:hypothetical protein
MIIKNLDTFGVMIDILNLTLYALGILVVNLPVGWAPTFRK